jgi:ectoine hydroxylase-related dioxygenase (phytanoyl-CoA dioxygenase family)
MARGDVLFFNGSVVHGSGPNKTTDRFRRAFICHYAGESAEKIARFYDVLRMDGTPLVLDESTGGGPCGDEIDRGPH